MSPSRCTLDATVQAADTDTKQQFQKHFAYVHEDKKKPCVDTEASNKVELLVLLWSFCSVVVSAFL